MLDTPKLRERIEQEETVQFILRVMVAIVILYDHVHPTGVFAKGILRLQTFAKKPEIT